MKNIKLFFTLLVMTLSFTAVAQSSFYDANACAKVTNKKSACNQGTEPFYKFIAKFQSSASFREQRLGEYVEADMVPNNFKFKVYRSKNVNISGSRFKECATWRDVSKNSVTYIVGFYSGSHATEYYTFERIDGKWYLTEIDGDA